MKFLKSIFPLILSLYFSFNLCSGNCLAPSSSIHAIAPDSFVTEQIGFQTLTLDTHFFPLIALAGFESPEAFKNFLRISFFYPMLREDKALQPGHTEVMLLLDPSLPEQHLFRHEAGILHVNPLLFKDERLTPKTRRALLESATAEHFQRRYGYAERNLLRKQGFPVLDYAPFKNSSFQTKEWGKALASIPLSEKEKFFTSYHENNFIHFISLALDKKDLASIPEDYLPKNFKIHSFQNSLSWFYSQGSGIHVSLGLSSYIQRTQNPKLLTRMISRILSLKKPSFYLPQNQFYLCNTLVYLLNDESTPFASSSALDFLMDWHNAIKNLKESFDRTASEYERFLFMHIAANRVLCFNPGIYKDWLHHLFDDFEANGPLIDLCLNNVMDALDYRNDPRFFDEFFHCFEEWAKSRWGTLSEKSCGKSYIYFISLYHTLKHKGLKAQYLGSLLDLIHDMPPHVLFQLASLPENTELWMWKKIFRTYLVKTRKEKPSTKNTEACLQNFLILWDNQKKFYENKTRSLSPLLLEAFSRVNSNPFKSEDTLHLLQKLTTRFPKISFPEIKNFLPKERSPYTLLAGADPQKPFLPEMASLKKILKMFALSADLPLDIPDAVTFLNEELDRVGRREEYLLTQRKTSFSFQDMKILLKIIEKTGSLAQAGTRSPLETFVKIHLAIFHDLRQIQDNNLKEIIAQGIEKLFYHQLQIRVIKKRFSFLEENRHYQPHEMDYLSRPHKQFLEAFFGFLPREMRIEWQNHAFTVALNDEDFLKLTHSGNSGIKARLHSYRVLGHFLPSTPFFLTDRIDTHKTGFRREDIKNWKKLLRLMKSKDNVFSPYLKTLAPVLQMKIASLSISSPVDTETRNGILPFLEKLFQNRDFLAFPGFKNFPRILSLKLRVTLTASGLLKKAAENPENLSGEEIRQLQRLRRLELLDLAPECFIEHFTDLCAFTKLSEQEEIRSHELQHLETRNYFRPAWDAFFYDSLKNINLNRFSSEDFLKVQENYNLVLIQDELAAFLSSPDYSPFYASYLKKYIPRLIFDHLSDFQLPQPYKNTLPDLASKMETKINSTLNQINETYKELLALKIFSLKKKNPELSEEEITQRASIWISNASKLVPFERIAYFFRLLILDLKNEPDKHSQLRLKSFFSRPVLQKSA